MIVIVVVIFLRNFLKAEEYFRIPSLVVTKANTRGGHWSYLAVCWAAAVSSRCLVWREVFVSVEWATLMFGSIFTVLCCAVKIIQGDRSGGGRYVQGLLHCCCFEGTLVSLERRLATCADHRRRTQLAREEPVCTVRTLSTSSFSNSFAFVRAQKNRNEANGGGQNPPRKVRQPKGTADEIVNLNHFPHVKF